MRGARPVQQSVFAAFPGADVLVAFVWIDMVAGDSQPEADQIAATIVDSTAEHWLDAAPYPPDWAHRLKSRPFAGSAHYRSGVALSAKLPEWTERLVASHAHSQA